MEKQEYRSFLRAFATVCGSLLIALVCAELFVRIFVPVRNVGPSFTVYDPVYGKALKPGLDAIRITPEFTMHISTNSDGFRGSEFTSPPAGSVVFLGDSFTLGYGVDDGEEFPALLGTSLREHNATAYINAGVGDTGNGHWLKFLQNESERYSPSLIVLQFMVNDFDDNRNDSLYRVDADGTLTELSPGKSRARTIQTAIEAVPGLADSYLVGLMRQLRSVEMPTLTTNPSEAKPAETTAAEYRATDDELTWLLIEESLRICREKSYPVYGVIVGIEGARLAHLQSLLRSFEVPYLVTPDKSERPDLYYAIDGHWNAAGHVYVAEKIRAAWLAAGLLKQGPPIAERQNAGSGLSGARATP